MKIKRFCFYSAETYFLLILHNLDILDEVVIIARMKILRTYIDSIYNRMLHMYCISLKSLMDIIYSLL
jgi:hypothetical protein